MGYPHVLRSYASKEYAWAVPTNEAISAILSYGQNVLELGSGLGNWAWLLEAAGGNVVAVDDGNCEYKPKFLPGTIAQDGAQIFASMRTQQMEHCSSAGDAVWTQHWQSSKELTWLWLASCREAAHGGQQMVTI